MRPHRSFIIATIASLSLWTACASPQPEIMPEPEEETPVEKTVQAPDPAPKPEHAAHTDHAEHKGHHHDFNDVDKWVAQFEAPEREAWQKPKEVTAHMDISKGMTVVDLGSGTGYFLPWLQSAVGAQGKVIALDVAPKLVEHINKRAKENGWAHVVAKQIPMDDPQLEPASVDRILTVDTWHHIEGREKYAQKIAAALKPGGKFIVVEVLAKSQRKGPPLSMRLSPAQITSELSKAGLKVSRIEESLPEQYILVAQKP